MRRARAVALAALVPRTTATMMHLSRVVARRVSTTAAAAAAAVRSARGRLGEERRREGRGEESSREGRRRGRLSGEGWEGGEG